MDGATTLRRVLPIWRAGLPRRLAAKADAFLRERGGDIVERLDFMAEIRDNPSRTPNVLSLFDFSGNWARAFETLGWNVIQVDLKHGEDIGTWTADLMLRGLLQSYDFIDGVIAAPPCTAFTRAGAQYWPKKDASGETDAAVHLVKQALRVVDFLKPTFWAIENPAGRIEKLVPELRARTLTFDPADFAGWTTSDQDRAALDKLRARGRCSPEETELVKRTGAYTKYTILWGHFAAPLKDRVEPVRCTEQGSWLQGLGGACEATKAARSTTPEGFSLAFAAAQTGLSRHQLRELSREIIEDRQDPPVPLSLATLTVNIPGYIASDGSGFVSRVIKRIEDMAEASRLYREQRDRSGTSAEVFGKGEVWGPGRTFQIDYDGKIWDGDTVVYDPDQKSTRSFVEQFHAALSHHRQGRIAAEDSVPEIYKGMPSERDAPSVNDQVQRIGWFARRAVQMQREEEEKATSRERADWPTSVPLPGALPKVWERLTSLSGVLVLGEIVRAWARQTGRDEATAFDEALTELVALPEPKDWPFPASKRITPEVFEQWVSSFANQLRKLGVEPRWVDARARNDVEATLDVWRRAPDGETVDGFKRRLMERFAAAGADLPVRFRERAPEILASLGVRLVMPAQHFIHLQGIGRSRAKPAGEIRVGDITLWNFGMRARVEAIRDASQHFVEADLLHEEDGKVRSRRLKKDRLVGVSSLPWEGPRAS